MSEEEAIKFAGLMEDYLNIPSFVCEMIEKQLEDNKYKEVVKYIIQRRNEIESKENYISHKLEEKEKDKEIERLNKDLKDACEVIERLKDDNKYLNKVNIELSSEKNRLNNIIKEVREYITSYESISTIQGLEEIEANKDLDEKTLNEMVRRYMIVHDKVLEILDKENNNEDN